MVGYLDTFCFNILVKQNQDTREEQRYDNEIIIKQAVPLLNINTYLITTKQVKHRIGGIRNGKEDRYKGFKTTPVLSFILQ